MEKGIFITFEGGEASGKSTQSEVLVNRLRAIGVDALATKQPGGTEMGAELRRILKYSEEPLDGLTELFLFGADRAHHVLKIQEALSSGITVVSDRYADSTLAYQGYAREMDPDLVTSFNQIAMRGLVPDVTYYLRVPVEVAQSRIENSGCHTSRFDLEKESFHRRLLAGYDCICRDNPDRYVQIDGTLSESEVAAMIWTDCLARFLKGR